MPPVVTCRKMKPKVDPGLWCRSCSMNLKKRCGGLRGPASADGGGGPPAKRPPPPRAGARAPDAHKRGHPEGQGQGAPKKRAAVPARGRSDDEDADDLEHGAEEQWVQCEDCETWRKLPAHLSLENLPDAW